MTQGSKSGCFPRNPILSPDCLEHLISWWLSQEPGETLFPLKAPSRVFCCITDGNCDSCPPKAVPVIRDKGWQTGLSQLEFALGPVPRGLSLKLHGWEFGMEGSQKKTWVWLLKSWVMNGEEATYKWACYLVIHKQHLLQLGRKENKQGVKVWLFPLWLKLVLIFCVAHSTYQRTLVKLLKKNHSSAYLCFRELTVESPKQFEAIEEQLTLGEEKTSAVNRNEKNCMKALETFFCCCRISGHWVNLEL